MTKISAKEAHLRAVQQAYACARSPERRYLIKPCDELRIGHFLFGTITRPTAGDHVARDIAMVVVHAINAIAQKVTRQVLVGVARHRLRATIVAVSFGQREHFRLCQIPRQAALKRCTLARGKQGVHVGTLFRDPRSPDRRAFPTTHDRWAAQKAIGRSDDLRPAATACLPERIAVRASPVRLFDHFQFAEPLASQLHLSVLPVWQPVRNPAGSPSHNIVVPVLHKV